MQIRSRLTFLFVALVGLILLVCFSIIFYSSANYRKKEFYSRLENKAYTTADLLLKVDQVDSLLLTVIDRNKKDLLFRERVVVYNYLNKVVYATNDTMVYPIDKELINEVRLKGYIEFESGRFEVVGMPLVDKYNRFVVFAGAIDRYGYSKLNNLRITLLILYIIMISIAALAGYFYSTRALKPILNVMREVDSISPTDLSKRVGIGENKDEIEKLAETFNKLLDRIEETMSTQKSFLANASHELKNPLTMVTSQLEVALLKTRNKEEYIQIIQSVLEDVKDINDIIIKLMELARLTSANYDVEMNVLRIDEVLWQVRNDFQKQHQHYHVEFDIVNLPDDEKHLQINGNERLLKLACINLMENACKFSSNDSVEIKLNFTNRHIVVNFINEGKEINPADLPYLFDPFYRSKTHSGIKGHGIGLSLVKRIFDLHGFNLDVASAYSTTRISLSIPIV
jgi:signal transduction histidine kinase